MRATIGRWRQIATAVAVKDLRGEARGRTILTVWLTLGLLLLAVVFITVGTADIDADRVAPSALWLIFALIGTLAVGRGYTDEHQLGGWLGVLTTPAPPGAVYLGKFVANLVVMLIAELAVIIGYSLVVAWPADSLGLLLTIVLGTIGLSAVGTLAAAFLSQRDAGDLLLPLMVIPVVVPVVALAAQATRESLATTLAAEWATVLVLLAGYDLLLLVGATAAFGFVATND